jgi:hypothetical protein
LAFERAKCKQFLPRLRLGSPARRDTSDPLEQFGSSQINARLQGKTNCFGSKEAMAEFMKNPTGNLAKAQAYYSKKQPG